MTIAPAEPAPTPSLPVGILAAAQEGGAAGQPSFAEQLSGIVAEQAGSGPAVPGSAVGAGTFNLAFAAQLGQSAVSTLSIGATPLQAGLALSSAGLAAGIANPKTGGKGIGQLAFLPPAIPGPALAGAIPASQEAPAGNVGEPKSEPTTGADLPAATLGPAGTPLPLPLQTGNTEPIAGAAANKNRRPAARGKAAPGEGDRAAWAAAPTAPVQPPIPTVVAQLTGATSRGEADATIVRDSGALAAALSAVAGPPAGEPSQSAKRAAAAAPSPHQPAPEGAGSAAAELAFAARVRPVAEKPSPANVAREPLSAPGTPVLKRPALEEGTHDATVASDAKPLAPPPTAALERSEPQTLFSERETAIAQPPRTDAKIQDADIQAKPAEPLKDISVRVPLPGKERVEVRVTEHAGELRVAVRTGDADLAHGMRQGLSDLVGRLQENGYRAEAWRPAATVPLAAAAEAQNTSHHSGAGDPQSQPGWSQQDGGRQQQGQSDRPRWVEELESNLNESQGDSHGIGS